MAYLEQLDILGNIKPAAVAFGRDAALRKAACGVPVFGRGE